MQAVALYGQQREAREERARAAGLQERETRVHEKSAETTAAAERSLAEHRIAEREATKQYHTEMLGLERKRLDAAYQERDFMQERYRLQLENEQRAIKAGLDTAIERERTRQMAMELHQLDVKVRRAALDVELEKLKQVNAEDPDIKLLERAVKVSETLAEQPPAQAYTSLLETEDILNLSAKSAKARTLALANAVEAFAVKMPPERAAAFRAKAAPLLQVQPTPPRPKSPAEGAVVEGPAQDRTTRLPIAGPQQNGIPGQTVPTTPPLAVGGPEPPPPAAPRAPQSSIGMRSSHPPGTVGRDKATGKLIMVRADGTWQPLQGKR
jgi:hypothetical protein